MAEVDVISPSGDSDEVGDKMREGGGAAVAVAIGGAHSISDEGGRASSMASSTSGRLLRTVRLNRRAPTDSFGFSLRGGREHGTGFFISHVEPGSEAYNQGLRAGDQVVRVNNMNVEQAVHREVTAMVQANATVLLHIRNTGIIPQKEHRGDPLTWLVVEEDDGDFSDLPDSSTTTPSTHESEAEGFPPHHNTHHHHHNLHHPQPHHHQHHHQQPPSAVAHDCYARVYLSCNSKVGLGCSICKGPPEKPGIFVQTVRVGGVARNAGLRPGDQIIACNDVPFAHLDFAEAVYVLKSSPRLALDLVRGAGLDLVAGESSGYNSSASSVAGDQTPPSSSTSDPRDSDHSVASRLSAVSRNLILDRSRGWREIESEWAIAEAAEKKQQQFSQKTLKTRAQRDASHRINSINSRSLSNLTTALREEEDSQEQRTAFRDGGCSPPRTLAHTLGHSHMLHASHQTLHAQLHHKLRSAKSTNDLSEDTSHKIALVTSADPHVNNIVVSSGPKNERDAVLRLDQLSCTSQSRSSTLSSGTSKVTVHSSSGSSIAPPPPEPPTPEGLVERQLRELRREQLRLQEEAKRLARERQKFEEEKRRGLERTQSAPLAPLVITCSGQPLPPHLQSPPSPTSSIASGRHTTRVLIKSPPPPPPPRKNTTTLTSHQGHSDPRQVSPPASPAHSSSSSSGLGSSCGSSAPPRRCKSIGSLSASSGESAVWEDAPVATRAQPIISHPSYRSSMPPPPPPKPPAPHGTFSNSTNGTRTIGGAPPPPPPPPPPPSSADLSSAVLKPLNPSRTKIPSMAPAEPSLAEALKKELEQRSREMEEQHSFNGDDASRAQQLEDKIDAMKKDRSNSAMSSSNAQHDKLMQEFKSAYKKMIGAPKDNPTKDANDNMPEKQEIRIEENEIKIIPPPPPSSSTIEFSSKIITNSSKQSQPKSMVPLRRPLTATKSVGQVSASITVRPKSMGPLGREEPNNTTDSASKEATVNKFNTVSASGNISVGSAISKFNSGSVSKMSAQRQWTERSGVGYNSSSTFTKPPLRPTVSSVAVMEFKPNEKTSTQVRAPNTYFEPNKKPAAGKPLVSIGTYSHHPTPVKMDFLLANKTAEVNGQSVTDGQPPRASLQSELASTLSRSNLRRVTSNQKPGEFNAASPKTNATSRTINASSQNTNTASSNTNGRTTSASFTTTTIQNNNATSPQASLSSKYRGVGQGTPVTIVMKGDSGKENEAPESPPAGILKPSGPATPNKPLQKTISFGDVTTVGEEDTRT